jgi:PhnB protein
MTSTETTSGTAITGREAPGDLSEPRHALSQFYRAFNARDLTLMAENWDDSPDAVMDNPLGGITRGWPEIRSVYEQIFRAPNRVTVELYDFSVHVVGDVFWAVGRERRAREGPSGQLNLAIRTSRLFRRREGRWRQVHHHGSFDDPNMLSAYQEAVRGESGGAPTTRPARYRNAVVPHIYIDGAAEAVGFYRRAFGAEELFRIAQQNGRILHSELSICGSTVMLGDPGAPLYGEPRRLDGCTASLHLMVDDNAAVFARAIAAGCETVQPPTDMFYGASSASVRDPFGHVWVLLTWKEDLAPAEMERRGREALRL